jgi:hypothetical protein
LVGKFATPFEAHFPRQDPVFGFPGGPDPLDFFGRPPIRESASNSMLIDGVMLLWFILTALSVAFVALDIRATPEHPVMKWMILFITLGHSNKRDVP